jgi:hypothetical protein
MIICIIIKQYKFYNLRFSIALKLYKDLNTFYEQTLPFVQEKKSSGVAY